ncbi:PAAR domain-containing protein [Pseudomonas sp. Bout1]|uniref:PAAR domain-containing protein n=1 Tax=Pseudomonas sp. Bout1 TaxID=3048600 RepID=UPI002AB4918F|nr:PAAR domain-containing protein [Pseudomonas sp. Bout1]MDY7532131.1 PAAR domain-containing protein [Pseudomonas sp. Bout1]MEB0189106.1 PAAR domain-containing protein [Pseudomonas sp. Bout1]
MNEGFFIGKGNKTTCGGEVLDGDPRVNIMGLLHACAGDRVTCGVDGKTYRIVGGISHIESHGRLVAGTLDSRSDCPCNARLIPTELTAKYRNESAAPQMDRRMAKPAHSTLTSPSVAPRQSAFTGNSVPPVFNSVELQEPGFYVAPQIMSRQALEALLFPERDLTVLSKFWALNPDLNDVKAGSMIVLSDPKNTSCTYQEAQLMAAAQQVKASLDGLTPEEADFRFRYGAEIASYIGSTSAATWLGVSAVVMETHLSNLRDTLQGMERLHQESYRQHGHLKSPQFFADRKRLMAQLNTHLLNSTRLRGQTSLGDHPKLKTALGISSRSLVHHWDKAGGPGQIPGYIAIGISGVSSLLAIQEVCSGDSGAACEKIKFTEGGKFGLSTLGGAAGGGIGKLAGMPICLALGFSTGIGGIVCVATLVGTGAWVGTTLGEVGGEYMGERIYEARQP